ncbi:hypothetical protein LARI1_G006812 [Lachnellula arida]|uniref:Uncharacterized protein n=1 Tax=Lachnellula arida TaxID=1316785 RepID=A0A8T9B6L8_9HELO|nr:hypothetical protein LARI1_G006812 [Lachnellula arida]
MPQPQPLPQKSGRGGAGNFHSPQVPHQPTDLESQSHSQQTKEEYLSLPLSKTTSSQQQPEYAHTGRGGAGNWIKPSSNNLLHLPITNPDPNPSPSLSPAQSNGGNGSEGRTNIVKATYRGGRGGAGNYEWGQGAVEAEAEGKRAREEEEEEKEREKGRRVVDGEVESALRGLRRPGRVVVGDDARKRGG